MASNQFHTAIRKYHRWLGFFLAGIMSIYAVSGVLLIFRKTDFMKFETIEQHQLSAQLSRQTFIDELGIKGVEVTTESPNTLTLNIGTYDKKTGVALIARKRYPLVLDKLVNLHKSTHNSPLYWLNIAFGLTLLFFVVSAFFMFMPRLPQHKNGLKIAAAGGVFALLVVIFGS